MIDQPPKKISNDLAEQIMEGVNRALRQIVKLLLPMIKALLLAMIMAGLKLCPQRVSKSTFANRKISTDSLM